MIASSLLRNRFLSIKIRYVHKLFVLCLLASILTGYFFGVLNTLFFHYESRMGMYDNKGIALVVGVFIAPGIETFLCNLLPNLILRLFTNRFYILLIIPSILFGLFHTYNPVYVVYTFFGGIILNYLYLKSMEHERSTLSAFILTGLLHTSFNLFVLLTT